MNSVCCILDRQLEFYLRTRVYYHHTFDQEELKIFAAGGAFNSVPIDRLNRDGEDQEPIVAVPEAVDVLGEGAS